MEYIIALQNVENVFHVTHNDDGPWTLPDMEDLASTFADWEDGTGKLQRSIACSLHNITVTDLTALTGSRLTRPVDPPVFGTQTGDAQANNVTYALKADIHNRGRGKNGRTFWVGLAEQQTAGSSINGTNRDAIVSAMNGLLAAVTAANPNWQVVVPHRVVNNIKPPIADYSRVFLYSATDDILDSQRNRLPNHHRRHVRSIR